LYCWLSKPVDQPYLTTTSSKLGYISPGIWGMRTVLGCLKQIQKLKNNSGDHFILRDNPGKGPSCIVSEIFEGSQGSVRRESLESHELHNDEVLPYPIFTRQFGTRGCTRSWIGRSLLKEIRLQEGLEDGFGLQPASGMHTGAKQDVLNIQCNHS